METYRRTGGIELSICKLNCQCECCSTNESHLISTARGERKMSLGMRKAERNCLSYVFQRLLKEYKRIIPSRGDHALYVTHLLGLHHVPTPLAVPCLVTKKVVSS